MILPVTAWPNQTSCQAAFTELLSTARPDDWCFLFHLEKKDQSLPRTNPGSWPTPLARNERSLQTLRQQILNSVPSVTETNIDIRREALLSPVKQQKSGIFTQEVCQQSRQMRLYFSKLQSNYPIRMNMPTSNCNSLCWKYTFCASHFTSLCSACTSRGVNI